MKKEMLIVLLLLSSLNIAGKTEIGDRYEGLQTYDKTVNTNGTHLTLVLTSELGNLSYAREWEVSITIVGIGLSYVLAIYSNQANGSNIVPTDEAVGIDTTNYKTRSVQPEKTNRTNLIWMIEVSTYEGSSVLLTMSMVWGYADRAPSRVYDDSEGLPTETVIPIPPYVIVLVGIVIGYVAKTRYEDSIENEEGEIHTS